VTRLERGALTRFDLIESGAQSVRFANPAHDFPKRIAYRRDGDVLSALIDDGSDSGQQMSWRWHRCRPDDAVNAGD
jgi:hypothetical protein